MSGHQEEIDPSVPYQFTDFDGESLRFVASGWADYPYLSCEYRGEGPVVFGGSDDVVRTALAMLVRGANQDIPGVEEAVASLTEAVWLTERDRKFERGERVEVRSLGYPRDSKNKWEPGVVVGYADRGEYLVLPDDSGVYLSYDEDSIRELSK